GGPATINNTGSFLKSGGTGSIASGTAHTSTESEWSSDVCACDLSGGDSRGSFNAAAGATLNFAGGTMTLESNSTLTAAGTVSFSGATVEESGRGSCRGSVAITGGAVSLNWKLVKY